MTDHELQLLQSVLAELMQVRKLLQNKEINMNVDTHPDSAERDLLSIEECERLSGLKRSYLYRLTHERRIPHCKPGGNRVYIRRDDLLNWMGGQPVKTNDDIDRAAAQHMVGRKR